MKRVGINNKDARVRIWEVEIMQGIPEYITDFGLREFLKRRNIRIAFKIISFAVVIKVFNGFRIKSECG